MGIDNIEALKPPPRVEHDPKTCGGPGICLPCSTKILTMEQED